MSVRLIAVRIENGAALMRSSDSRSARMRPFTLRFLPPAACVLSAPEYAARKKRILRCALSSISPIDLTRKKFSILPKSLRSWVGQEIDHANLQKPVGCRFCNAADVENVVSEELPALF